MRRETTTARESAPADRFRALAEPELARLYASLAGSSATTRRTPSRSAASSAYRASTSSSTPARRGAGSRASSSTVCRDHGRARAARRKRSASTTVDEFSLFRKIADEDPFPYSDSLHLDFLEQFGREDVRAVLAELPDLYRIPLVLVLHRRVTRRRKSRACSRRHWGPCSPGFTGAASSSSASSGSTPSRMGC